MSLLSNPLKHSRYCLLRSTELPNHTQRTASSTSARRHNIKNNRFLYPRLSAGQPSASQIIEGQQFKSQLPTPPTEPDPSTISIFIVDDDADNLLYAQYAVEGMGYKAAVEIVGKNAVSSALASQPDIILLDILLPGTSGLEILPQLRSHASLSHIPVIAVTAVASAASCEQFIRAGFSDVLVKPYLLEEMSAMLKYHLSVSKRAL